MKVDLHCHSTVSDGQLAPDEVVRRAAANGVELLALTDHDELSGLAMARSEAVRQGIKFIDGVEISVSWEDLTIHIVGLNVDPLHPLIQAGLASVRSGRDARAGRIATALEAIGVSDPLMGARRLAGDAKIIGRLHFARYLVEQRFARDVRSVFDHYLVPGKPGYVDHSWAKLEDALNWIHAAGGVAVVAHPARYRVSRAKLLRFFETFKAYGGEGVEVVSGMHSPAQIREFAKIAQQFDLGASVASDFHGPEESGVDLGALPPLPENVQPIWQRFV